MTNLERVDATPSHGGSVTYNLTIRDYFAAKAMQAIISTSEHDRGDGDFLDEDKLQMTLKWMPFTSYQIADAMLAARAKEAK